MIQHISDCVELNNGVKMPWLGLGVYKAKEGEEVEQAVKSAINAGYRSIDTATLYQNEVGVGKAVRDSEISRKDLFITTKVWNDDQGYDSTLKAFENSLKKLDLDYIDLYLIHWPVTGKYKETWKALERIYEEGLVRAIGVSNFNIHHLQNLMVDSNIKPTVNQVEFHPRLTQVELRRFCKAENIQVEAWRPLTRGKIFDHPTIVGLAEKYSKTPAQVILRWDLQHEVVTIPKSVHEHRIKENADIFDFEIMPDEMAQIDNLNANERFGPDPDTF